MIVGYKMKLCCKCNQWFHDHCEELDNDQQQTKDHWYCHYCIGIHQLPIEITENIFINICTENEGMFLTLSLVCKRWRRMINTSFQDKINIAWLDREYYAICWSNEKKLKYNSS